MKCQIKGCNVERADLSQHIRCDHKLSVADYKQQYNVKYVIDESKRLKRGATRKKTNQKTKQYKCEVCNEACLTQKALRKHYIKSKDSKHSQIIFNEYNVDDWVECKVCGLRRSRLDIHLKFDHNMSTEQYVKSYQVSFLSKNFIIRTSQSGKNSVNREQFVGSNNPFYGKHHSLETKDKISKTTIDNNSKNIVHFNLGRKHTDEVKKRMSNSRVGDKNPMFGKQPDIKTAHSIHGYRKDIGHSVRSTLEANYARYLKYIGVKYEYELKPFVLQIDGRVRNCWIDFYLVDFNEWVELKNYLGRDIRNIEILREQYKDVNVKILYGDSSEWRDIEDKYSKLIPMWETENRNLKTHPELYLDNIDLNYVLRDGLVLPIIKSDIEKLLVSDREKLADILFEHFKKTGFPRLSFFEKELIDDFMLVRTSKMGVDGKLLSCYNNCGYKVREHFINEQYFSFKDLFDNDNILRRVIRNRLGLDKRIPEFFEFGERLLIRGFEVLYPSYRFSKYNILLAKWVVENFCKGNKVYDYSCGWGARLIGAVAAGKSYVGVDTNYELVKQLLLLGEWLRGFDLGSIKIINEDAAKYVPDCVDLAYSCPPYGVREHYRHMKIIDDNEWFDCYLKPVIKNCFEGLRVGGKFVCHIGLNLRDVVNFESCKYFKFFDEFFVKTRYSPFVKNKRNRVNESILVYEKV